MTENTEDDEHVYDCTDSPNYRGLGDAKGVDDTEESENDG